jgi:hypothetical protein
VGGARTIPYNPVLLGFGQGAVGNLLILGGDFSPVSGTADFSEIQPRFTKTKASYSHFIR